MQLNHLHLHVSDLTTARAFYERWFGFRDHVRHGSILFMRDAGDLDLALAHDSSPGEFPDWFHFGFRLDSIEAVEEMHTAMRQAGVMITMPYQSWGDLASYRCADPDGHQIEVYWE